MSDANEKFDLESLQMGILEKSKADNWSDAKQEWTLQTVFRCESSCLCGHRIMENCVIFNDLTDQEVVVGNVCINHFNEESLRVPASVSEWLRRFERNPETRANHDILDLAVRLQFISERERSQYIDYTRGPGSRSRFDEGHPDYDGCAVQFRDKINRFLQLGFVKSRPKCHCGKFARPRQSSKDPNRFFYGCFDFPRGCEFRCFDI